MRKLLYICFLLACCWGSEAADSKVSALPTTNAVVSGDKFYIVPADGSGSKAITALLLWSSITNQWLLSPTTFAASNIFSGGQLPAGTLATNTATDGLVLSSTGDKRKWVDPLTVKVAGSNVVGQLDLDTLTTTNFYTKITNAVAAGDSNGKLTTATAGQVTNLLGAMPVAQAVHATNADSATTATTATSATSATGAEYATNAAGQLLTDLNARLNISETNQLATGIKAAAMAGTADATNALWSTITSRKPMNVLDYGADATGATDSTSAFDAAFAAVGNPATNGIFVPAGSYTVSRLLSLPTNGVFYGVGGDLSKIMITPVAGKTAMNNTNPGATIRDVYFLGSNTTWNVIGQASTITGVCAYAYGNTSVERCRFEGFSHGLLVNGPDDANARPCAGRFNHNYFTNCWVGLHLASINGSEYTSVEGNDVKRCYYGILSRGAGNITGVGNTSHDCYYALYHGGLASVTKGNSLWAANTFNHGQVYLSCPGGGLSTLTFANNSVDGGGQLVVDGTAATTKNVCITHNKFGISYIFFSGTVTNIFVGYNQWAGNVPNRFSYPGPDKVRFWNNYSDKNNDFIWESDQTPMTSLFYTNYTCKPFDQVLICTGTNQLITLRDASIMNTQTNNVNALSAVGKWIEVIATDPNGYVVVTNANGSQTIKNNLSVTLTNSSMRFYSDGSVWR